MGYRTFVSIRVVEFDTTKKNASATAKEAFKNIINKAEPCTLLLNEEEASFEDNNGNTVEATVEASKSEPGLLMEAYIDGTSEDSNDQRAIRIRNGKEETNSAEITYPPFQEIVTEDEKIRNAKARKVSYGRDDLLDVAEKMANEFCDTPIGEELCSVMADAAYHWLSTIIEPIHQPILKPGWADQRKPEVNALRKKLVNDITRLLLSTNDEIIVFRDYDEDKIYLDLNVGNKISDGTYPTVMNVSLSSTKKPCISLDLGYEEKELPADDLEFSTDDLASIYDAMLWIFTHSGEVDE